MFGTEENSVLYEGQRFLIASLGLQLNNLNTKKNQLGFYLSGHPLDKFALEQKLFVNTKIEELSDDLSPLEDKTLFLTGTIVGCEKKTTKNGNLLENLFLKMKQQAEKLPYLAKITSI